MPKKQTTAGYMHKIPADIQKILASNQEILEKWNSLTLLARNEWICWVTIVKKIDTRKEHINRLQVDILKGKKRPCCWPGCPHHNPKAKKWFKDK
jgi:uncharacterized protein YdeI (YjbR/CyaY-like superfamily)